MQIPDGFISDESQLMRNGREDCCIIYSGKTKETQSMQRRMVGEVAKVHTLLFKVKFAPRSQYIGFCCCSKVQELKSPSFQIVFFFPPTLVVNVAVVHSAERFIYRV